MGFDTDVRISGSNNADPVEVALEGGGIYLEGASLWLDPRRAQPFAIVSHAHSDHIARHAAVLCSAESLPFLEHRLGKKRRWLPLDYGEPYRAESGAEVRLYPAGHAIGSSMVLVGHRGERLLYTGDFKLRKHAESVCRPCQPVKADILVMETTYGKPSYMFPEPAVVIGDIVDFCNKTMSEGAVPVLFAYSLGKAQEVTRALELHALNLAVHTSIAATNRIARSLGVPLHDVVEIDPTHIPGNHVLLLPPSLRKCPWLDTIPHKKTAMISGWALDRSAIYRYQCDAAFPLSDHADYGELLDFVQQVGPRRIYTVHGFAKEFAADLRRRGWDARALSHEEQLEFTLD